MRHFVLLPTVLLYFLIVTVPAHGQEISTSPTPSPEITTTLMQNSIETEEILDTEVTPTPTINDASMQVVTDYSEKITAGLEIDLPITIENGLVHATYLVKVMIYDESHVVNKTFSEIDNKWIAWNASWDAFPQITLDGNGYATLNIPTIIYDYTSRCECDVVVRLRSENGKNEDFEIGTISVVKGKDHKNSEPSQPKSSEKTTVSKTDKAKASLIVDAKKFPKETLVELEGVVTSPFEELGANTFYLEDSSGGIKVVLKDMQKKISRGDALTIIGSVQEAYGEKYIKINTAKDVHKTGKGDLPDPIEIPTGEIEELHEGKLVFVNGQVVSTSGNTYYIDDGSGPVKIYIKESTRIEKPKMRTGYYSAVTGIVSQYRDDYRVLPRVQEDVIVSLVPIDSSVLGSVALLPETGIFESIRYLLGFILIGIGIIVHVLVKMYGVILPRNSI